MKKIIALLLILSISSLCIFSCKKKDKDDKNDGTNDGTSDVSGPTEEPDDDTPDNIDPDGWTKVDK